MRGLAYLKRGIASSVWAAKRIRLYFVMNFAIRSFRLELWVQQQFISSIRIQRRNGGERHVKRDALPLTGRSPRIA